MRTMTFSLLGWTIEGTEREVYAAPDPEAMTDFVLTRENEEPIRLRDGFGGWSMDGAGAPTEVIDGQLQARGAPGTRAIMDGYNDAWNAEWERMAEADPDGEWAAADAAMGDATP